jgi:predicted nuclease with TOPRIM domain
MESVEDIPISILRRNEKRLAKRNKEELFKSNIIEDSIKEKEGMGKLEELDTELQRLRSENQKLKEQLQEITNEMNDRRKERVDLLRQLRVAKSIIHRSRKVSLRYNGESIKEFLKDIKIE